jgi:hypothetical protein
VNQGLTLASTSLKPAVRGGSQERKCPLMLEDRAIVARQRAEFTDLSRNFSKNQPIPQPGA